MARGYDHALYIQPFDHRGSFQTRMFGWRAALTGAQTAEIAAAKRVIFDGFKAAIAGGVPGFIGFAVGRTVFWQPLADWRAGKATREAIVATIGQSYREYVDLFDKSSVMTEAAVFA
ncbi:MAG: DUF2090 domain-containing protein [Acetobacteraceae bacterium]|jgi:myo-inositol catabolism protein IolC